MGGGDEIITQCTSEKHWKDSQLEPWPKSCHRLSLGRGHHCCCHFSLSAQQALGSECYCCHLFSLNKGHGCCPLHPIRILHCPELESSGYIYLTESRSHVHTSAVQERKVNICLFNCSSGRGELYSEDFCIFGWGRGVLLLGSSCL